MLATGFDALTGACWTASRPGRRRRGRPAATPGGPRAAAPTSGSRSAGFPNLFIDRRPGQPVRADQRDDGSIEQHALWIGELIAHAEAAGYTRLDVDPESERTWTAHVADVAAKTLYPKADTYYLSGGAFMPYVGGVRGYRRICESVAAEGYKGFVFSRSEALSPTG